jgi:hypothetical protein
MDMSCQAMKKQMVAGNVWMMGCYSQGMNTSSRNGMENISFLPSVKYDM